MGLHGAHRHLAGRRVHPYGWRGGRVQYGRGVGRRVGGGVYGGVPRVVGRAGVGRTGVGRTAWAGGARPGYAAGGYPHQCNCGGGQPSVCSCCGRPL
jgi:hypothetical protein